MKTTHLDQQMVHGATRDNQSITSDWQPLQTNISGVVLREVKNVYKRSGGTLTELYRQDWKTDQGTIDQVFQNILEPGQVSAWHMHEHTTDRLFVNLGSLKVVLFDGRNASPTRGVINEFCLGLQRPGLLVIPPGVWHGVKNIGSQVAALINMVDRAYAYDAPDHWRLPSDSDQIPFSF